MQQPPPASGLISNKELAYRWECDRTTCRKRRRAFGLRPVKFLGMMPYFDPAEVERVEHALHTLRLRQLKIAA